MFDPKRLSRGRQAEFLDWDSVLYQQAELAKKGPPFSPRFLRVFASVFAPIFRLFQRLALNSTGTTPRLDRPPRKG